MSDSTKSGRPFKQSSVIRYAGWVLVVASFLFGVGIKDDVWCTVGFYACVAVLIGVAAFYLIERSLSAAWRDATVRLQFGPYLIGATIWSFLISLLWLVCRYS